MLLLSFHARAQRIQNLAYALIERGIGPGNRVVVVAPNCPMIAVGYAYGWQHDSVLIHPLLFFRRHIMVSLLPVL